MTTERRLILGGPGCGKTTRLLDIVNTEIISGTRPARIAFCAFTKTAATEARERAAKKFNLSETHLPFFQTIHSICFKHLELNKAAVMSPVDWKAIADATGVKFTNKDDEFKFGEKLGDKMIFIFNYSRMKMISLKEGFVELGWNINFSRLKYFCDVIDAYKVEHQKVDFTDMLDMFCAQNEFIDVDVAFIDEAQDLTRLQWRFVKIAFKNVKKIFYAGDDNQAIYEWAGADVPYFINMKCKKEVLPISYRLPKQVFLFANEISKRILKNHKKVFKTTGRDGTISIIRNLDELDLKKGTWLLIARNKFFLSEYVKLLKGSGFSFIHNKNHYSVTRTHALAIDAWLQLQLGIGIEQQEVEYIFKILNLTINIDFEPDKKYSASELGFDINKNWDNIFNKISISNKIYYSRILMNNESIKAEPRIIVDTFHGVKGMEADNVCIMCNLTKRTFDSYKENPDPEHRAFYVAVTRAKQNLHIVSTSAYTAYRLPQI